MRAECKKSSGEFKVLGRVVLEICTDAKAAVALRRHGGEC